MEKRLSLEERMVEIRNEGKLEKFVIECCKSKGMKLDLNRQSRKLDELVKNSTVMKVLEFYCVANREIIMKKLSGYSDKEELLNVAVLKCLFHLTLDYLTGRDSCLMEELEELAKDL
jgi:hypothetical protein